MNAARHPWFAWLLALALALLPMHAMAAKAAMQSAASADLGADPGDCHGNKKAPDAEAPACAGCGVCHAVQDVTPDFLLFPGPVVQPEATRPPVLHGTTTQPDLHPPLA
jgi:cytochrome c553